MKKTFIPPDFRPSVKGEKLESTSKTETSEKKQKPENRKKSEVIVCIYVKDDASQTRVIRSQFPDQAIRFFTYDDLGDSWHFSYSNQQLIFLTDDEEIHPTGIYNRPHCPEYDHPKFRICTHLLKAIEAWGGTKIGATSSHFHNSSKGYQMTTTLKEAINSSNQSHFDFPKSYYIKGTAAYEKLIAKAEDLIVKSGSGIRSEVATEETFGDWDRGNIENLPTLFQQAIRGSDIRVHWMRGGCWQGILKEKKGSIDYRYAKSRKPFERHEDRGDLAGFCQHLAEREELELVGVDFIQLDEKYYCLESNPNPGWAGFHRASGDEPFLCQNIIKTLGGQT